MRMLCRGAGLTAVATSVALTSISIDVATAKKPKRPPFKLLVLDGRTVAWLPQEPFSPTTITWSVATKLMRDRRARNCRAIVPPEKTRAQIGLTRARFQSIVKASFDAWEATGVVRFTHVADPARANIVVGEQLKPRGIAYANVTRDRRSLRPGGPQVLRAARVCLNGHARWKIGFDGDLQRYDLKYVLMHEIGHALGLDHPGATGQVMSWRYDERFTDLQPGDIEGLRKLYRVRRRSVEPKPGPRRPVAENHKGNAAARALAPSRHKRPKAIRTVRPSE